MLHSTARCSTRRKIEMAAWHCYCSWKLRSQYRSADEAQEINRPCAPKLDFVSLSVDDRDMSRQRSLQRTPYCDRTKRCIQVR
jgi:hypothetical protein